MELVPIEYQHALKRKRVFDRRRREFEHPTLVFDAAHLLALEIGDTSIDLLHQRARVDGQAEWFLDYPYAVALVQRKAPNGLEYSYSINSKRSSFDRLKIAIALNALIKIEDRVK
jgi:hypothetical protein